jgi:hypothetical protein
MNPAPEKGWPLKDRKTRDSGRVADVLVDQQASLAHHRATQAIPSRPVPNGLYEWMKAARIIGAAEFETMSRAGGDHRPIHPRGVDLISDVLPFGRLHALRRMVRCD